MPKYICHTFSTRSRVVSSADGRPVMLLAGRFSISSIMNQRVDMDWPRNGCCNRQWMMAGDERRISGLSWWMHSWLCSHYAYSARHYRETETIDIKTKNRHSHRTAQSVTQHHGLYGSMSCCISLTANGRSNEKGQISTPPHNWFWWNLNVRTTPSLEDPHVKFDFHPTTWVVWANIQVATVRFICRPISFSLVSWRSGLRSGNGVARINEVTLHRAWDGWRVRVRLP